MSLTRRLVASTRLIALLTLGSRILGLLRECVYSYFLGTSELLSAFRIAFMVPNLARRLFGEGALSSALIPVLTESLRERGEEASRVLVGQVLGRLVAGLSLLVLILEAVTLVWHWRTPDLALELTMVLLPYMVAICTVAVASGVLNVREHFSTPAAAPMLLNLGIIGGAVLGHRWGGWSEEALLYAICAGVLVAGLAQLALITYALKRVGFVPIFRWRPRDPAVGQVFRLMAPMILGLSAMQINALLDYVIAYLFVWVDGERIGPSVLGYAQYLYQLPLGVFGISVATAIFPLLAQKADAQDDDGLADVFAQGIRLSLFVALPAAVGLLFVAEPLIRALYERGEFAPERTIRVAMVLQAYALGIPAYFAQHVVTRTFYARQDSRTPARIALKMVGVNLLLNLTLVFVLQECGLALATAISATIQVTILSLLLRRHLPSLRRVGPAILRGVLSTGGATAAMAAALLLLTGSLSGTTWTTEHRALWLGLLVAVGSLVFAATARLLRVPELNLLLRRGTRAGEAGADHE
jgi:putative peptidoglycan lipid II flippase